MIKKYLLIIQIIIFCYDNNFSKKKNRQFISNNKNHHILDLDEEQNIEDNIEENIAKKQQILNENPSKTLEVYNIYIGIIFLSFLLFIIFFPSLEKKSFNNSSENSDTNPIHFDNNLELDVGFNIEESIENQKKIIISHDNFSKKNPILTEDFYNKYAPYFNINKKNELMDKFLLFFFNSLNDLHLLSNPKIKKRWSFFHIFKDIIYYSYRIQINENNSCQDFYLKNKLKILIDIFSEELFLDKKYCYSNIWSGDIHNLIVDNSQKKSQLFQDMDSINSIKFIILIFINNINNYIPLNYKSIYINMIESSNKVKINQWKDLFLGKSGDYFNFYFIKKYCLTPNLFNIKKDIVSNFFDEIKKIKYSYFGQIITFPENIINIDNDNFYDIKLLILKYYQTIKDNSPNLKKKNYFEKFFLIQRDPIELNTKNIFKDNNNLEDSNFKDCENILDVERSIEMLIVLFYSEKIF